MKRLLAARVQCGIEDMRDGLAAVSAVLVCVIAMK
jgi:hypothetical protein